MILTTFDLDEYVFEAIRVGRQRLPREGHRAGRAAAGGAGRRRRRRPAVAERHPAADRGVRHRAKEPAGLPDLDRLTDREREVVGLVAEGLTNDEIAARLIMSAATAKTHVSRAMIKLGARDRAQLVVFAYETGLVRPGWQR